MMFELESFFTLRTFEFPEDGAFVVADHVTLQTVNVGERFVAHRARLKQMK